MKINEGCTGIYACSDCGQKDCPPFTLKKGDIIQIRKDLDVNMECVNTNMLQYAGRKAKVLSVGHYDSDYFCTLDVDNEDWEWFIWLIRPVKGGNVI